MSKRSGPVPQKKKPVETVDEHPTVKPAAVSFTDGVLTVDLAALDALPQGERQSAVKIARSVVDRLAQ